MIQLNACNYAWNKRKHDTAQHSCVRHLGNALDKRDWRWHLTSAFSHLLRKYTFTAVHTKTHKRRFQIYPLWRAFSNLCVYGERFHRLRVDRRPKRIKSMRLLAFAFTIVFVWTGPESQTFDSGSRRGARRDGCFRWLLAGCISSIVFSKQPWKLTSAQFSLFTTSKMVPSQTHFFLCTEGAKSMQL